MAENLDKINNYELGIHFTPDLEEAELKSSIEELENVLNRLGANVTTVKEAKRTRLSYPIRHKFQSFFGTIDFRSNPEILDELNKELKLQEKILRYLVLKHEENEKVLRAITTQRSRPRVKPQAPVAKKEEIKPEELEKQIEKVIEKL